MKRNQGYVSDAVYPTFFYKEMQPEWLNTIIQFLGFQGINLLEPFSYLELACGTGMNLIVAAINHPDSHFVGVDFNPQHIHEAQNLAEQLELNNIDFIEADFQKFLENNQNSFDFIVNHGTYSWVAPEQQKEILAIASKFLKKRGIFYLHYMCYPGSTNLQPIQKLFNLVDQHTHLPSCESIEIGKSLFSELNAQGAFINHPQIDALLNTINNSPDYLAHELLTDHWQPLYSVDVHKSVNELSGLSYLASAQPVENLESISIPSQLQPIIAKTNNPKIKEYLKDLARNTKQRTDIYQNQPIKLQQKEHLALLTEMKFELMQAGLQRNVTKFQTPIGEITAPHSLIEKMLQALAKEQLGFQNFMQLQEFQQNPIYLIETLFLLMSNQYIYPVRSSTDKRKNTQLDQFNQLMQAKEIGFKFIDKSPIPIDVN